MAKAVQNDIYNKEYINGSNKILFNNFIDIRTIYYFKHHVSLESHRRKTFSNKCYSVLVQKKQRLFISTLAVQTIMDHQSLSKFSKQNRKETKKKESKKKKVKRKRETEKNEHARKEKKENVIKREKTEKK